MLVVYFTYILFHGDTLTLNNITFGVMSGFIYSADQSAMSLLFKTNYTSDWSICLIVLDALLIE